MRTCRGCLCRLSWTPAAPTQAWEQLLLGHSSHCSPDSAAPLRMVALGCCTDEFGIFLDGNCCTWVLDLVHPVWAVRIDSRHGRAWQWWVPIGKINIYYGCQCLSHTLPGYSCGQQTTGINCPQLPPSPADSYLCPCHCLWIVCVLGCCSARFRRHGGPTYCEILD